MNTQATITSIGDDGKGHVIVRLAITRAPEPPAPERNAEFAKSLGILDDDIEKLRSKILRADWEQTMTELPIAPEPPWTASRDTRGSGAVPQS